MKKKRLLLITTQSLFGTGIIGLLEEQKENIVLQKVPDVQTALVTCKTFQPDVIVYFRETSLPEEETMLQELMSRYPTRVIHCTLEANQLTIYDRTRIKNATVDDLMSAVLK